MCLCCLLTVGERLWLCLGVILGASLHAVNSRSFLTQIIPSDNKVMMSLSRRSIFGMSLSSCFWHMEQDTKFLNMFKRFTFRLFVSVDKFSYIIYILWYSYIVTFNSATFPERASWIWHFRNICIFFEAQKKSLLNLLCACVCVCVSVL